MGGPARRREAWIDVAKGLGIILVVMGHAYGSYGNDPVQKFIYAFHIPLFFFIAGYLYREPPTGTYGRFLKRKIRTRVLPYFLLALVSTIVHLFRYAWTTGDGIVPLLLSGDHPGLISRIVLGIVVYANEYGLTQVNAAMLWFLPCLFITENLFYAVRFVSRRSSAVLWLLLALLSALSYGKSRSELASFPLPWMIDTACMMVLFYGAGHAVREAFERRGTGPEQLPGPRMVVVWLVATCTAVLVSSLNIRPVLLTNTYGNYAFFLAAAIAGTASISALAVLLNSQRWLAYLGMNTLIIFGLDGHINPLAAKLFQCLFGQTSTTIYFMQKDLHVAVLTAWAFIVALPLLYIYNKLVQDLAAARQGRDAHPVFNGTRNESTEVLWQ